MAEATRRRTPPRKRAPEIESTHTVQAAVENVELHVVDGEVTGTQPREACAKCGEVDCACPRVEFMGSTFRISDRIGLMPLLKFAHAADSGLNSETMEGMAAQYAMIRDCIDSEDWARFERHAIDGKAGPVELDKVTADVIAMLTVRPTSPPGDSSAGRQPTSDTSKVSSPPTGTPPPQGLVSVDSLLDR